MSIFLQSFISRIVGRILNFCSELLKPKNNSSLSTYSLSYRTTPNIRPTTKYGPKQNLRHTSKFRTSQKFLNSCKKYIDVHQSFMNLCDSFNPRNFLVHATHVPTHPRNPPNPRILRTHVTYINACRCWLF